jgi:hypothetical protein
MELVKHLEQTLTVPESRVHPFDPRDIPEEILVKQGCFRELERTVYSKMFRIAWDVEHIERYGTYHIAQVGHSFCVPSGYVSIERFGFFKLSQSNTRALAVSITNRSKKCIQ